MPQSEPADRLEATPDGWMEPPPFGSRELWEAVVRDRWLIIVLTTVVTGAALTYGLLARPIYRAAAVVVAANADRVLGGGSAAMGQFGGLASLAGLNLESKDSDTEEALAVMRSRQFVEQFVEDHKLAPRFFPRKWDAKAGAWAVPPEKQPTLARAAKYFSERLLSVSRNKKTGLISVNVEWSDRGEAAKWANELVARVNAEMKARAMANASAYTGYLEREFRASQLLATREAIGRLIEQQVKQGMLASVSPEFAFRTVTAAMPPDADDVERPKPLQLTVTGFAVGLLVSLGAAFVRARRRAWGNGDA
jgi:uncharacterized protein involved in exopolysaccharide biosynthesis